MTFKVPDQTEEKLNQMQATYTCVKISHTDTFRAEVRDKLTNQIFSTGIGHSKEEALVKAVDAADPSHKPRTPAEIAAENKMLRERLARMENPEIKVEGKPTIKAKATTPSNPVNGKKVAVADGESD